jgi:hypothetical protein
LIKLDIEGLESAAMRGMSELFQQTRPDIFCEVLYGSGTEAELSSLITPLGYRTYALNRTGVERLATLKLAATRRNYLFTMRSLEEINALLHASL